MIQKAILYAALTLLTFTLPAPEAVADSGFIFAGEEEEVVEEVKEEAPPLVGESENSDFLNKFIEIMTELDDFGARDMGKMVGLVKTNLHGVPGEVEMLIERTGRVGVSDKEKEPLFFIAEFMAKAFAIADNDRSLLLRVKRASFDARLSEAAESSFMPGEKYHLITTPPAVGDLKNYFLPDNIIINQGETVRWINTDVEPHIFASIKSLGEGDIFSPEIETGGYFDYSFEYAGEYYYMCFIHQGMVGKVLVNRVKGYVPREGVNKQPEEEEEEKPVVEELTEEEKARLAPPAHGGGSDDSGKGDLDESGTEGKEDVKSLEDLEDLDEDLDDEALDALDLDLD